MKISNKKVFVILFILSVFGLSGLKAEEVQQLDDNLNISKQETNETTEDTLIDSQNSTDVKTSEKESNSVENNSVENTTSVTDNSSNVSENIPSTQESKITIPPTEKMKVLPIEGNSSKKELEKTQEEQEEIKATEEVNTTLVEEKKTSGVKKTEEEQLKGYSQITNWLIDNKKNFEDVIKENAIETKTKWFVEEKYKVQQAKSRQDRQDKLAPKSKIQKLYHLVKKGDTLYSISKTYNLNQEDILKWNNITGPEGIQLGKVLTLYDVETYEKEQESKTIEAPVQATDVETNSENETNITQQSDLEDKDEVNPVLDDLPEYKYYRVKRGDTFSSIAKSHYMSKEEFISLNSFDAKSVLSVDQIVKVKSNYGHSAKKTDSGIVKDGFIWPVVGRLLIPFGTQEQGLVNEGINIGAKKGTNIKATQEGIVIYIGDGLKSFGNLILIQHDKNWISAYAHVNEIKVAKGQKVLKGQAIAKVSDSGDVNTPQLHFELRYNVKPMDPLNYLVSYR